MVVKLHSGNWLLRVITRQKGQDIGCDKYDEVIPDVSNLEGRIQEKLKRQFNVQEDGQFKILRIHNNDEGPTCYDCEVLAKTVAPDDSRFGDLTDIKRAVDEGLPVRWCNPGYHVIKDKIGQYLVVFKPTGNCVGLTDITGEILSGEIWDYFVEGER